jgi:hypothetical protein
MIEVGEGPDFGYVRIKLSAATCVLFGPEEMEGALPQAADGIHRIRCRPRGLSLPGV